MGMLDVSTGFSTVSCYKCGMVFALPTSFFQRRKEDEGDFYCPSGHKQYFPAASLEARLKAQLERDQKAHGRTRKMLEQERRSHSSTKGQLTKSKKKIARVKNGVCPCCNRSFVNLRRHMGSKHPDFKA